MHFSNILHFFSPAAGKIEMTLCPLLVGVNRKQAPSLNDILYAAVVRVKMRGLRCCTLFLGVSPSDQRWRRNKKVSNRETRR